MKVWDLRSVCRRRLWLYLLLLLLVFWGLSRLFGPGAGGHPPGSVPVFDWGNRTTVILGPGL